MREYTESIVPAGTFNQDQLKLEGFPEPPEMFMEILKRSESPLHEGL